ncbi:MerR family transcriptional regulator [Noviherbaspirillum aerium]|uniref:MerR family transcriptional regulator n=1 Tax=Noviherbaspirillum aerium TaxID=2588497 RepID=UPI00124F0F9A|nr:MerR family transcriptional regulator [Noviherbaspirillum aerium]
MLLKVGELAKRTGLTVRTLHHYDAIGLLRPSARSEAGYRLYHRGDVERLYRIQALRRLDLPLSEVAVLLEGDARDLESVIDEQVTALERQIERAAALRNRLQDLRRLLGEQEQPELNEWLSTLEMMAIYDRYFTREEYARMRKGSRGMKELNATVVAVRSLMERGVAPDAPEAIALAEPWSRLSLEHMDGDPRLMLKLDALHRNEPGAQALTGVDTALLEYMTQVTAEYRLSLYARHLGSEEIARVRNAYLANYRRWPAMFAEARELMEGGAAADSPEMQAFCARWIALFRAVWGNDPAMRARILDIHAREPGMMTGSGVQGEVMALISQGLAHLQNNPT